MELTTSAIPKWWICELTMEDHTGEFILGGLMFCVMIDDVLSKDKSTPVTGRGSPQDCETSRFPHFSRQSA
jgi:hypothetical protein